MLSHWHWWTAAAAGIAGLAVALSPHAHAQHDSAGTRDDATAALDELTIKNLTAWLKSRGVNLAQLEVQASKVGAPYLQSDSPNKPRAA